MCPLIWTSVIHVVVVVVWQNICINRMYECIYSLCWKSLGLRNFVLVVHFCKTSHLHHLVPKSIGNKISTSTPLKMSLLAVTPSHLHTPSKIFFLCLPLPLFPEILLSITRLLIPLFWESISIVKFSYYGYNTSRNSVLIFSVFVIPSTSFPGGMLPSLINFDIFNEDEISKAVVCSWKF